MRNVKKAIGAVLAATMIFAMSATAFAAVGVSSDEQAILEEAKKKATELGIDVNTSKQYQSYYAQAETYLAQNDLTKEQVNEMVATVDEAASTVKTELSAKGVVKVSDLSSTVVSALKSKVTSQIQTAAKKAGITISVAADGTVSAQNIGNGTTVADNAGVIKQTGANLNATVVVAVMFLGAVAACGIIASKKKLFAKAEA